MVDSTDWYVWSYNIIFSICSSHELLSFILHKHSKISSVRILYLILVWMHLHSYSFFVSSSHFLPFLVYPIIVSYDVHISQHDGTVVNVRTSTVIVTEKLKYLLFQFYWFKLILQHRNVAHWSNINTHNTKLGQMIMNLIHKMQKRTFCEFDQNQSKLSVLFIHITRKERSIYSRGHRKWS
jgi:hypothetical protein